MHEQLITYIEERLERPLGDDDISCIKEAFVIRKLRRHQYLLQQGDVCNWAGFIVKGALRLYSVDETGRENVLGLMIENWWAGDRESFLNGTPSPYSIDALEPTEMLLVNKEAHLAKLQDRPFMKELIRILTERQAIQLLRRVHTTKTMTAEQRLADLENTYPEFLQRFPQRLLASYLGMTKETFSRVKASSIRQGSTPKR
ncbi:MAG TPA: Crp/Fnr family transcriptional regulator [Flavobacterium sp.]|nr:Crp/Fnr family transcriptional regulator [Flavobacterium sp.]